jgi:hypothetical protein
MASEKPKIKGDHRNLINGIISAIIDQPMDAGVKSLAQKVSKDSILHDPRLLRIMNGLLGLVENNTDKIPNPIIGSLAEQGIGGLRLFASLMSGNIEIEKHASKEDVETKSIQAAFQKNVMTAKTKEEVTAMLQTAAAQLDAIKAFAEMANPCKDKPKEECETPKPKPPSEIFQEATTRIDSLAERLNAAAARRRRIY